MIRGREQERARLRSLVTGLREGRSFASLVRGPAGIGKSTLIGDLLAVPAALLGLLAQAAEARPVLAVVDDAHWLDAGTLDAVLFAAQRVAAEGIGVLLATPDRDGAPVA